MARRLDTALDCDVSGPRAALSPTGDEAGHASQPDAYRYGAAQCHDDGPHPLFHASPFPAIFHFRVSIPLASVAAPCYLPPRLFERFGCRNDEPAAEFLGTPAPKKIPPHADAPTAPAALLRARTSMIYLPAGHRLPGRRRLILWPAKRGDSITMPDGRALSAPGYALACKANGAA